MMSDITERPKVVMRPPRVMSIPREMYDKTYWPHIREALNQIILQPMEISFSQEELYRNVYNVCCQRHTVLLYDDLLALVSQHLTVMYSSLLSTHDNTFIQVVSQYFVNFKRCSEIICSVFRYLERVYIVEKLNTSLKGILKTSFNNIVVNTPEVKQRLNTLLKILPPQSDPTMIMNLVKGLYELDKSYSTFNPQLFTVYIPCFQPSRGLEMDLKETMVMIHQLKCQGFGNSDFHMKRKHAVAEMT